MNKIIYHALFLTVAILPIAVYRYYETHNSFKVGDCLALYTDTNDEFKSPKIISKIKIIELGQTSYLTKHLSYPIDSYESVYEKTYSFKTLKDDSWIKPIGCAELDKDIQDVEARDGK